MKNIDVTKQIIDVDGEGLVDPEKKPITYRKVLLRALGQGDPKQYETDGEKAIKTHFLRERIAKEDRPELTAEEIVQCKKMVMMHFIPQFHGPVLVELEKNTGKPTLVETKPE